MTTANTSTAFEIGQYVLTTTGASAREPGDEERATVLDVLSGPVGQFLVLQIVDAFGHSHRLELERGRDGWEDAIGRAVEVVLIPVRS